MPFCFLCGAYRCQVCQDLICQSMLPFEQRECFDYIVPVYSLFDWNKKNDQPLRYLISKLKGGAQTSMFERFALEFLKFGPFLPQEAVLIPAPAATLDHAFTFAHAVAGVTGIAIWPLLEKQSSSVQKTKSRQDRLRLKLKPNPFEFKKFQAQEPRVIFIDDVITSGATAQAAFYALNSPACFEVWTIARRSLL